MKHLLITILVAILLSSCDKKSAEQEILDTISLMHQAVKENNLAAIMPYITEDFTGNCVRHGTWDKSQVTGFLGDRPQPYSDIDVHIARLDIVTDQQNPLEATMSGTAYVTGSNLWFPDEGLMVNFDGYWKKHKSQWQLYSLGWE